jgi:hypothetical protein
VKRWSGVQERLESTDLGRAVLSALIVVTLVVIVVANLPPSALQRKLVRVSEPYIDAIGINQVWGVFAPEPLRQVVEIEATARYADGTSLVWKPPHGLPFPDSYRDIHWIRWLEVADKPDFYEPTGRWLAEELTVDGRPPVEIALRRRTYGLLPPGSASDRAGREEDVLFVYDVASGTVEEGTP